MRSWMKMACQSMNTSRVHSWRLRSTGRFGCSSSSARTEFLSSRASVRDSVMMARAQSYISSRSHSRIGTGKPSLAMQNARGDERGRRA